MPTEILSPSSKAMAFFAETTFWGEMAPELSYAKPGDKVLASSYFGMADSPPGAE